MKKTKKILHILTLILIFSAMCTFYTHAADENLFSYSTGYFYDHSLDGYIIRAKNQDISGDIVIPDIVDGKPVEAIGHSAFAYCENITSVTIPDSVKYIGHQAFYGCTNLETITFQGEIIYMSYEILHGTKWFEAQPDGEIYIGSTLQTYKGDYPDNADLIIKEGTKYISDSAFNKKRDIGKIVLPSTLEIIGENAFSSCSADAVIFNDGLLKIGKGAFAINEISDFSVPDTVTEIGYGAFRSNPIKKIKLSENITELPDLFSTMCPDTIHIPKNVEKIDLNTFKNASITNLTIDEENRFYYTDGYGLYNKAATILYLYFDKQTVKPVFADSLLSISENCFRSFPNLEEVVFPSSLSGIGESAFKDCRKLKTITFNDGLLTIGVSAFASCYELTEITIPDSVAYIYYGAFANCTNLTTVKLPENLTELDDIFSDCVKLKTLHIPKKVKYLTSFLFWGKFNIESFTVDEDNPYYSADENGILFNKEKTILVCYPALRTAETYTVPQTVTKIDDYAFEANTYLKKVVFTDTIEIISDGAFYRCGNLSEISVPDKAFLICWDAFYNTKWYKNHPDGVMYIGKIAYGYKGNLKSKAVVLKPDTLAIAQYAFAFLDVNKIIISDKLESVGAYAFYYTGLDKVTYSGTEEQWKKITINPNGNGYLTKATKTYSTIEHIFLKTEGNGATFGKNGTLTKYCDCGYVETDVLYGINEKVLSQSDFVYNGKQQAPSVVLKNLKGNKLTGISVCNIPIVKDIGKYKITIKLREPYEGEKTVYFTIRPGTTEEVKATQTTSSVTLKWSKVKKATGYRVYQYDSSTGEWKTLKTTTERTYTVKNLKSGTKYEFSIKAYTKTADGTIWSKNTTRIETATKPATPTIKLSSVKKGTANISWSNVSGESGYQVYYSDKKNGDYIKINNYSANTVKTSKAKLTSGKTYYFKVRAYKKTASGTVYGSFSSVKSIKTK